MSAIAERAARNALQEKLTEARARLSEAGTDLGTKIQRYARDPFALIDDGLVYVMDLETLQVVQFKLWPHQRELIEAWVDIPHLQETGQLRFRNVHEEKSRQMGITWVTAYVAAWALNFHAVPGLALSQKLGEICDSGPTTDSFFGRIKFIHERLPELVRAPLRFIGGNDPQIRNPRRTSAFLTGEGATLDPGRGGKFGYVFLDEAARIPWGESVHAAVTRACPHGRFYNSTPAGEDDVYYRLRAKRLPEYVYLRHHWSDHPWYGIGLHIADVPVVDEDGVPQEPALQLDEDMEQIAATCPLCAGNRAGVRWDPETQLAHRYPGKLTSPWYDAAVVELTDEQVARELDIDYTASLTARVYTEFTEEIHVLDEIAYEPLLPIYLSWDFGWEMTAVGIWQLSPTEMRKIGEWEGGDQTPDQVAAGLRYVLRNLGVEAKNLQQFETLTWLSVGDPAGDAKSPNTGTSLFQDYRREGFAIVGRQRTINSTIIAVKRLLRGRPLPMVVSRAGCPETISHFKSNRWPVDRQGKRKEGAKEPQNDRHNHMMRADAYLITHLFPPPTDVKDSMPHTLEKDGRSRAGWADPELPGYDDPL